MKRIKLYISLLALAVLLGGCPYESNVVIDEPSIKINDALLGKWKKEGDDFVTYKVTQHSKYSYRIEKQEQGKKDSEIFIAHFSHVDDQQFLNLSRLGEDGGYYLYMAILNSNKEIRLREVTENITENFTESASLKAFISKHKGLSFFYNKGEDVLYKTQ